ncbi:MAG: redoxin family protein [Planctomycetota bacterium]
MKRRNSEWLILLAPLALAVCLGCRGGDSVEDAPWEAASSALPAQQQPAPEETPAVVETPAAEEPPPPPTIPEVLLTDALRQTCLVAAGDPMPDGELSDLEGQKHAFGELFGEKLTVVFFWTLGTTEFSPLAAQGALEDLQMDVYEPYAEKGVGIVAVNEGDAAETVRKSVEEAGAGFTNLLDPDGALFARVATEKLPRVYLLDADGKVLWFDLEFSRTTRDNLVQALQVALGESGER